MSASNYNWVCFDCRISLRQPKTSEKVPNCPECGEPCYCLGYKVNIPRRSAVKAWHEIREESRKLLYDSQKSQQIGKVRRKHFLEKKIAEMEQLELNKDRSREIRELKEELKQLG